MFASNDFARKRVELKEKSADYMNVVVNSTVRPPKSERRPLVSGIIWLGLGIFLFMLVNDWVPSIEMTWPVVLIIVGGALIIRGLARK